PEDLGPGCSAVAYNLTCCANIVSFLYSQCRISPPTFTMVSQIEQKCTKTSLACCGGALQHFQARAVQTMSKDDDRLICFTGVPPALKFNSVGATESNGSDI